MTNFGTLKEITDLRSIWPHEALNFTPWVAENVDLLADAVGLDITVDETESSVGDFNVDIYASETGTDRKIIKMCIRDRILVVVRGGIRNIFSNMDIK